jgi:flagellin-specific chaperone FliS
VSAEESLRRAEELMERLEASTDPEAAIEILTELSDIATEVEAELSTAKREVDADG